MDIYVNNQYRRIGAKNLIAKGGEAEIYDIGSGLVAKIYKQPGHPDFVSPADDQVARLKLQTIQAKLAAFPQNLPQAVVAPRDFIRDKAGQVLGYTMEYISNAELIAKLADPGANRLGLTANEVAALFIRLHQAVTGLHAKRVVIGDFNDLNILIANRDLKLIDADSYQYDRFLCQAFTMKFGDPLKMDFNLPNPTMARPFDAMSDWYAFSVLLMQSLVYVGPYGGVYRPKDPKDNIPHDRRLGKRITVFHPDVRYPKPALPLRIMPDELMGLWQRIFEKDERQIFPEAAIRNLRFTHCPKCGREHARSVCPDCQVQNIQIVQKTLVKGNLKVTEVARNFDRILAASVFNGQLRYLGQKNGDVYREDKQDIVIPESWTKGQLKIAKQSIVCVNPQEALRIPDHGEREVVNIQPYGRFGQYQCNSQAEFFISGGVLYRRGLFGPERIGDVLGGLARFWVGERFGYGFDQAGQMLRQFVFPTSQGMLDDSVKLPGFNGQLLEADCHFGPETAWLLTRWQQGAVRLDRVVVFSRHGAVKAFAEYPEGSETWLANLSGKIAADGFLLSATDDGIVRVDLLNGQIGITKQFAETEAFVDASTKLLPGPKGLYAVRQQDILELTLG